MAQISSSLLKRNKALNRVENNTAKITKKPDINIGPFVMAEVMTEVMAKLRLMKTQQNYAIQLSNLCSPLLVGNILIISALEIDDFFIFNFHNTSSKRGHKLTVMTYKDDGAIIASQSII